MGGGKCKHAKSTSSDLYTLVSMDCHNTGKQWSDDDEKKMISDAVRHVTARRQLPPMLFHDSFRQARYNYIQSDIESSRLLAKL